MADVVTVAEAGLKSKQGQLWHVALVQSQAGRIPACSARFASLEGTITERKSLAVQVLHGLSTLPTKAANIEAAVSACTNASVSPMGSFQELERRPQWAEKDMPTL